MASSTINQTVDAWTSQALVASSHLVRLYRSLHDDRQAALALRVAGPCEERAKRISLQVRTPNLHAQALLESADPVAQEAQAWQMLVEAYAGLSAFHGLVDDQNGQGRSLRSSRTATNKALHLALRGFRVAFPEEMAAQGIRVAIEYATCRVAEAFTLDVKDATDQEKLDLHQELHTNILEALTQEVTQTERGL